MCPNCRDDDAVPPSPVEFARAGGIEPDAWQEDALNSQEKKLILNCSRQSGKSTTTAIKALYEGLYVPGVDVLMLSPVQRQSAELLKKVLSHYNNLQGLTVPSIVNESAMRVEFSNGSRVIALPGSESSVRGYAASLVIIDEAARVPDPMIMAITPSLATTNGRIDRAVHTSGPARFLLRELVPGRRLAQDRDPGIAVPAHLCGVPDR